MLGLEKWVGVTDEEDEEEEREEEESVAMRKTRDRRRQEDRLGFQKGLEYTPRVDL